MRNVVIPVLAVLAFVYMQIVRFGVDLSVPNAQSAVQASQLYNEATTIFTYIGAIALLYIAVQVGLIASQFSQFLESQKEDVKLLADKIASIQVNQNKAESVDQPVGSRAEFPRLTSLQSPASSAHPTVAENKCPICGKPVRATDVYCGGCNSSIRRQ